MGQKEERNATRDSNRKELYDYLVLVGVPIHKIDALVMEGINCKGHDLKERLMMSRRYRIETSFDKDGTLVESGYYIRFITSSSMTQYIITQIGPIDTMEDSEGIYNDLVKLFGFSNNLLIGYSEDEDGLGSFFDEEPGEGLDDFFSDTDPDDTGTDDDPDSSLEDFFS